MADLTSTLEGEHHRHSTHRRENKKKKRIRQGISYFTAYLMTLVFTLLFLIIGIYAGVFNDNVILNRLNKSNYYQSIYTTIMDNAQSVIMPTGLDVSVLDGVITKDMVYIGAKQTIEQSIQGNRLEPDVKTIKNSLRENILAYAKTHNMTYDSSQEAGLNTLCEAVAKEYTRMLDFPFVDYYVKYKAIYLKVFWILVPVIILLSAAMILVLLKLHRFKHQGIRYIAYSMLAASIMTMAVPIGLLISGDYRKISVSPQYFYHFMVSYIEWDITIFLYIGGIGLVIFAGLLLMIGLLKKKLD